MCVCRRGGVGGSTGLGWASALSYWVDIERGKICRFDPASQSNQEWLLGTKVGFAVLTESGQSHRFRQDVPCTSEVSSSEGAPPGIDLSGGFLRVSTLSTAPSLPNMLEILTPQQLAVYKDLPGSERRAMTEELRYKQRREFTEKL